MARVLNANRNVSAKGMNVSVEKKPGAEQGEKVKTKLAWIAPVIVFFVSLSVYLRCLHPGAAPADSSELVAAAHTVGAAHPPGETLLRAIASNLQNRRTTVNEPFVSVVCLNPLRRISSLLHRVQACFPCYSVSLRRMAHELFQRADNCRGGGSHRLHQFAAIFLCLCCSVERPAVCFV